MNKDNIAVLIKYDTNFPAPIVLAKAKGTNALFVKELAKKEGIPIVEDKNLSESLFLVEEGDFIDFKYFKIMAKILSKVYELKKKYE